MRRSILAAAIVLLLAVLCCAASAQGWNAYVIRNSSTGMAPLINDVTVGGQAAKEFVTYLSSQKAGLGTSAIDGKQLGDILSVSIDRLDDWTRFAAFSGPAVAPYFNIWITDGAGKYAVIANEPSNPEWRPGNNQWDFTWDYLKTRTLKVYENNDKSWLPNAGVGLTFQDLASFTVKAPSAAEIAAGWSGLGGGAPREFGTNAAYGFNWIFGDTLSNYVSGDQGFIVANPSVSAVPEPASMMALLLGLGGLVASRRRRA